MFNSSFSLCLTLVLSSEIAEMKTEESLMVWNYFRYARTLGKIFNQKSPQKIQETYDAALNLHAIHGSASSHFQESLSIQSHIDNVLFYYVLP